MSSRNPIVLRDVSCPYKTSGFKRYNHTYNRTNFNSQNSQMKILKLLVTLVGAKNLPFHIDENSPVRFITPGVFLDVTSSYRDIFGKLRTYHKKVLVDPAKLPKKVLKAIKDGKIDKFPNLSFAPTARKSPKTCINGRPYRFGCRYLRKTSYNPRYRTSMRN